MYWCVLRANDILAVWYALNFSDYIGSRGSIWYKFEILDDWAGQSSLAICFLLIAKVCGEPSACWELWLPKKGVEVLDRSSCSLPYAQSQKWFPTQKVWQWAFSALPSFRPCLWTIDLHKLNSWNHCLPLAGLKYDLKRVEELYYDMKIRHLANGDSAEDNGTQGQS